MIAKFSVKKPYTVLVGVVLVIVLGVVAVTRMTTDLLPDMDLPYVLVITADVGASPEEVESDVTAPIEAAMATTSNIKNVSSSSSDSYSMVILEYEQNTNMDSIIIEIQQELDQLEGTFPDTATSPIIMQIDPDMMPVMVAAADVEGMDQSQISEYVENELVPKIESIEGVASVTTIGDIEESVEVTMDQDKIDALNGQIVEKITGAFDEAQEQLDEAQDQIDSGKKELENGQDELASQMGQAQNEIVGGKIQTSTLEAESAVSLAALLETKKALEEIIPYLQSFYDQAKATEESANKAAANAGQAASDAAGNAGSNNIGDILGGSLNIPGIGGGSGSGGTGSGGNGTGGGTTLPGVDTGAISTAINGSAITGADINTYIDSINSSYSQILKAQGVIIDTVDDIPQAIAKLTATLSQVNASIIALYTGQSTLSDAQDSLDTAYSALNETMIKSILQMSEATAQLYDAEAQLSLGQSQIDSAKDSATEAADLTQILTVDMLGNLLVAQNFSMPAGYVNDGDTSYLIRVGDKISGVDELKDVVLLDMGLDGLEPIKLSDVANVELVSDADESYAKVNSNPGIMLSIEKQTGYSTGDVTDRVIDRFAELEKSESGLHMTVLMNQGVYIDMIVQSVLENMLVGAALAILILIMFLKDVSPTLVIACSIPLSVIFAIVLMYFTDISLNIISLSGLALGVGMLVDNSIVVIENIYRLRGEGYSIRKAAVDGASQVTGAIIASTLTTVCVFAPIIFTDGITRQLFVDIALTIAYTLTASLIVAMTFVPMMSSVVLKKTKDIKHPFFEKVQEKYGQLMEIALRYKALVLIGAVALLAISAVLSLSRGLTFMDMDMEADQITVTVAAKEDETLEFSELSDMTDEIVERISDIEGIDTIGAMIGGTSLLGGGDDTATLYLILEEDKTVTNAWISAQILDVTSDLDCDVSADSSSTDMSSFFGSGISVEIKGNDLDTLQDLANQVAAIVEATEGTVDVDDGLGDTTPSLTISVDKEKAAKYGMTTAQVFALVYEKMASATSPTTISTDVKDYKVYVQSDEQSTLTLDDIKNMTFTYTPAYDTSSISGLSDLTGGTAGSDDSSSGSSTDDTSSKSKTTETASDNGSGSGTDDADSDEGTGIVTNDDGSKEVPLTEIADFVEGSALSSINRDSQNRYISVTAGIDDDHNVTLVSNELTKKFDELDIPDGYSISMEGEDEMIMDAMQQLVLMLVLAVIFIYLVMVAQFQSLLSPFIIMFTIPLAFTGGLFGLFITGNELSVIGMIGFVMLSGIIVNNGIVMVDYINQLRAGGLSKREAIIESGKTRLRPILMTALTTILAMLPMAFGMGGGSDMMEPMAIVTVGGLVYGTLLTLIVVPCVYDAFNREKSMVDDEQL